MDVFYSKSWPLLGGGRAELAVFRVNV